MRAFLSYRMLMESCEAPLHRGLSDDCLCRDDAGANSALGTVKRIRRPLAAPDAVMTRLRARFKTSVAPGWRLEAGGHDVEPRALSLERQQVLKGALSDSKESYHDQ